MNLPASKRKHTAICLALAGIISVTATAWGLSENDSSHADMADASPATPIEVAEVVAMQVEDWSYFSGRLEAVERVEIRPQVTGVLTAVHFEDGAMINKGDLLFTIDPRPYVAAVSAAEARANYTTSELVRAERLLAENAIPKRDFEEKKNAAQVAQAELRIARLNLEYTQIRAPISGRASRAEITLGNLVTANSGPALTTLVSSDKVYAAFDVDEQTFLKYVNPARMRASTTGGTDMPVTLGLANEEGYPHEGTISSVDNRLDTTSGTIRVRAVFDSRDGALIPGLYARVRLGSGVAREAVLIAEQAVNSDQAKRYVLVVNQENKAEYREVKTGAVQDGFLVIESGLKPGQRIVVNGLQHVRPGMPVAPVVVSMEDSVHRMTSRQSQLAQAG